MKKLNKLLYLLGRNKNIICYSVIGNVYSRSDVDNTYKLYNQNNLVIGNDDNRNILIAYLYGFEWKKASREFYCKLSTKIEIDQKLPSYKFLYELYKVNYSYNTESNFNKREVTWESLNKSI